MDKAFSKHVLASSYRCLCSFNLPFYKKMYEMINMTNQRPPAGIHLPGLYLTIHLKLNTMIVIQLIQHESLLSFTQINHFELKCLLFTADVKW